MKGAYEKEPIEQRQKGSIMLITVLLLIILTILLETCIHLAKRQMELVDIGRDTSHMYEMAESGVKQEIQLINEALENELPKIVAYIGECYLYNDESGKGFIADEKAIDRAIDASNPATSKYDHIRYGYYDPIKGEETIGRLIIHENAHSKDVKKQKDMQAIVQELLYEFLTTYFLVDEEKKEGPEPFVYEVQTDHQIEGALTKVTVTPKARKDKKGKTILSEIILETQVETYVGEGKEKKTLALHHYETLAAIDVPPTNQLMPEIHEYYEWVNENNPSELLGSPLTVFGDLVIDGSNHILKVVSGDVQVKGTKQTESAQQNHQLLERDEYGGVLVMNGGKLEVAESLYCLSNVVVSNGWHEGLSAADYSKETELIVEGDIIAHTVGILDDGYPSPESQRTFHRGKNLHIKVGKNMIVEDDVVIDPFIEHGKYSNDIEVDGAIFGMGSGLKVYEKGDARLVDPNKCSGIYSQGIDTLIAADRMFIAGQPYIKIREESEPLKLFESIGAPFEGVAAWGEYAKVQPDVRLLSADYLEPSSPLYPFIRGDQVKTDIANSYAVEKISAIDASGRPQVGQEGRFPNLDDARLFGFMFQGGTNWNITHFLKNETNWNHYAPIESASHIEMLDNTAYLFRETPEENGILNYYNGFKDYLGYRKMAFKKWGEFDQTGKIKDGDGSYSPLSDFRGLKGYTMALRSVFFGKFKVTPSSDGVSDAAIKENVLCFSDVVDLSRIQNEKREKINAWSNETPIVVVNDAATIDISDFYKMEEGTYKPQPTILINTSALPLTIQATKPGKNVFRGMIVSAGTLHLNGDIEPLVIEGAVVAGKEANQKPLLTNEAIFKEHSGSALNAYGNVTIYGEQNILFEVEARDRVLYRSVLDALHLTQYTKSDGTGINEEIATILGPYRSPGEEAEVEYTMGKVVCSNRSYFSMHTEGIRIKCKTHKEVVK